MLRDVVTFLAPQAGSSQLSNLYIIYDVTLGKDVKLKPAERYTAYKYIKPEDLSGYRLDEASIMALEIVGRGDTRADYKEVANSATVYIDGASRGNPGKFRGLATILWGKWGGFGLWWGSLLASRQRAWQSIMR